MTLTERLNRLDPEEALRVAGQRLPPWITLALVVVLAWQLARLSWLLLAGPAPATVPAVPAAPPPAVERNGAAPVDVQRIVDAHLFGVADAARETPVVMPADVPETRLDLRLRGVIADADPARGVAIIADGQGQERIYRVDQSVPGGARLHAVHQDQVVINRNGMLETLRLPREFQGGSGTASRRQSLRTQPQVDTSPSVRQVVSDNAARITEVLRVQPYMEGGTMRGYRVYPGRNRQQFAALGLEPGDLVTEINGTPLSDPSRGMDVFAELGDATQVSITVERDGSQQNMMLDTAQLSAIADETGEAAE